MHRAQEAADIIHIDRPDVNIFFARKGTSDDASAGGAGEGRGSSRCTTDSTSG